MSVGDPKLNGRQRESRSWNASVFSFRSVGANVAKFSRSLEENPLTVKPSLARASEVIK
jgi:hypothetical protein